MTIRYGVSNLAWAPAENDSAFQMLAAAGFTQVEVAPTRIAPWSELGGPALSRFDQACRAAGLSVGSLQAILYGRPELNLLGNAITFDAMKEHFHAVADIAHRLGASVAVFGAPGNRKRGAMVEADAVSLATDRLRVLGAITAAAGLTIVMEPVPPYYGCDFLTRMSEVSAIVSGCDCAGIGAHADTACITLAGDDLAGSIAACKPAIRHFHIAEPDLAGFSEPRCDHRAAAAALGARKYSGQMVIEMREREGASLSNLRQALAFVADAYGAALPASTTPPPPEERQT